MNKLSKQHFWEWFKRHHQEFLAIKNKPKKEATYWFNELNSHLRAYYKFLEFSVEWQHEKTGTLTISVNGNASRFKKADDLIAKAPKIPGWNFVALDDPKPIDFMLEQQMKDSGIDPRELRFAFASDDPNEKMLFIYHPLCTEENNDLIHNLAHGAIYNLLGERSFGTDISSLTILNLSQTDASDTEELEGLPSYIGQRRSPIVVDSQGNLVSTN